MTIIIGEWARFLGEWGWLPRIGDRNAFWEGDKHAIFKSVECLVGKKTLENVPAGVLEETDKLEFT